GVPGLPEPWGDAHAQRHDVLLLEVEDRAEVHLRRVDEIGHLKPSLSQPVIKPSGHDPLARLVACRASSSPATSCPPTDDSAAGPRRSAPSSWRLSPPRAPACRAPRHAKT